MKEIVQAKKILMFFVIIALIFGGVLSVTGEIHAVSVSANKTVSVVFNANKGKIAKSKAIKEVARSEAFGSLPILKRSGYRFDGWFTKKIGGERIFKTSKVKTKAAKIVVYAHWTQLYTVKFKANGGSVSVTSKRVAKGSNYGALPTPVLKGYHFDGWYTGKYGGELIEKTNRVYATESKVKLYAHWSQQYSVKFDANGGKVSKKSVSLIQGNTYGALPVPTRYGYYFTNWYTEATGGYIVTADSIFTQNADSTIYAHWEKQMRVACVGASITWGTGLTSRASNCYPAQLQDLLGEKYLVGNFGSSGATIALKKAPYIDSAMFQKSIDFEPDAVVFLLGTNDARTNYWVGKTNFRKDYAELINFYSGLPSHPKIYSSLLPDVLSGESNDQKFNYDALLAINTIFDNVARENNIAIIDVRNWIGAQSQYYRSDGIHMNETGALMIAYSIYYEFNRNGI